MQTLSRGLVAYKKELQQQNRNSKSAQLLQQTIAIKQAREAREAETKQIAQDVDTHTSLPEEEPIHKRMDAIQSLSILVIGLNILLVGALGWLFITTYGVLFS